MGKKLLGRGKVRRTRQQNKETGLYPYIPTGIGSMEGVRMEEVGNSIMKFQRDQWKAVTATIANYNFDKEIFNNIVYWSNNNQQPVVWYTELDTDTKHEDEGPMAKKLNVKRTEH